MRSRAPGGAPSSTTRHARPRRRPVPLMDPARDGADEFDFFSQSDPVVSSQNDCRYGFDLNSPGMEFPPYGVVSRVAAFGSGHSRKQWWAAFGSGH